MNRQTLLWVAALGAAALRGEPLVLTVWNRPPVSRAVERELWDAELKSFQESWRNEGGPALEIRAVSRGYIQQQFVTVMAGGKGPDVVHVWVGALPTLAREGFLAPLDSELESWSQRDLIPEKFWEPARFRGKIYGVPYDSYFYTLLIRRDLWIAAGLDPERPPANWEELAQAAQRLTAPERQQYGFGFIPSASLFLDFVWQAGGELLRPDGEGRWEPAFHENAGLMALNFLRELRFTHKVMQPNPLASQDELNQLFALGRLAMMPGVANQMPDLISRYGMSAEQLLIAPLPAGPTGIQASHSGGDYFILNSQSPPLVRRAAWAYVRHVLSPINQLAKWDRMKKMRAPIFPGAFSVATDLTERPEFKLVKDAIAYARTEPSVENWPYIRDYLEKMVLERAMTDPDADAAEILDAAARAVRERLL